MATGTVSLRELVNPTPKQDEFLRATRRHLFTLYGGAGGGGKSYILRWNLVALLLEWAAQGHTGVMVGLFCEDYPSLKDRHLKKVKREFPAWLGRYREQDHEYHLNPQFGGGIIAFRNLDDPSKYASVEFAAIAVDELTKNERQTFDDLRWRRRWPGIARCPFMGATNPGSKGHGWVKKLWIDRDFSDESAELDSGEFAYIQARAADNPHLEPSYIQELKSLPEAMRRALLEGDWDVYAGQVFTSWRRDIHVEEPWTLPPGTRYFTGGDRGMTAASCVLRIAILPDGDLRVVAELYAPGLITSELGRQWVELGVGDYAVADPNMWSRQGHTGESEAEVLRRMGIPLRQADNDRINGMHRVHEWLKHVPGRDGAPSARLKIWPTCPHLIRELPQLVYDERRGEDVDDDSGIHHADAYSALRYGLMSRPAPMALIPVRPTRKEHMPPNVHASHAEDADVQRQSWQSGAGLLSPVVPGRRRK